MIGFKQSEGVGRLVIQRAPSSNAFTSAMLGQTAALIATLGDRDLDVLKACKRNLSAIRRRPPDARPAHALVEQTRFAVDHH